MEQQKSPFGLFLTLITIAFVLFFLDKGGFLSFFRGGLGKVFSPVAYEIHSLNSFPLFSSGEVKKLTDERNDLQGKVVELARLKKENEELRLQLDVLGVTPKIREKNLLSARVLSSSHFFIIDKGSNDGIKLNGSVIYKNVFVGKIVAVDKATSRVLLPTDEGSTIAVKTVENQAKGLVHLDNQDTILSEVTLSEKLSEGDALVTIGDLDEHGIGILPDLVVGKISQIHKSSDKLSQEAKFTPAVNYQNLTNVFVLF